MIRKSTLDKPRLTVAGPGAGKTHNVVDEIVVSLEQLRPHRQLVAITYTNAAARTIRDRLFKLIPPQRNIFIGTTHGFLNRFILQPFATVFGALPEERLFFAVDVLAIATKGGTKNLPPAKLNATKSAITKRLLEKGVVPYDAMLGVATSLLKHKHIRERVGRKLQFLFVDEFQDTDTRQFQIFDEIRKSQHTTIYVVGDPEQYISGFTYGTRGQQIPEFSSIPFFKFLEKATRTEETLNRRANGELVDFANQFRHDLKQKAEKPHRGEDRVVFIRDDDLESIIERFRRLTENVERGKEQLSRLYLSFANNTFDSVREKYGIIPVSNDSRKSPTLLGDALELLSLAVGMSQRRAQEEFGLTLLEWRQMGVTILRHTHSPDCDHETFLAFVKDKFGEVMSTSRLEAVREALSQLKNVMAVGSRAHESELCSSINKAKGLEADVTLVVARTPAELCKWLTTDRSERCADKQDKCRLGYVAITRPREMLCFACLKSIDDDTKQTLIDRGVTVLQN
jgi:DNA helicase-2/ATP-dependent DNA helicase PcrA